MLGSIYSGITGLRNFQDQLDIVANNIANVNTVGYKGSRATFQTLLFQNLRSGIAPQNQLGGVNPMQIGAGSQLASIDKIMTQGSPMSTGKVTDLMIQGEGFFILSDGTDQYYTRAGNFTRDYNGFFLEPATGMKLQGWTAQIDDEGNRIIDTNEPIGDIQVTANQIMEATETSFVALANNLNAGVGIQDTTIVVKSATGESIPIKFSFTRDMSSEENKDKNVYNWTASVVGSDYKFALYDGSTGYLTSTNEIMGQVELDNTGNVINWVNYDSNGVPIDSSKISIFDINGEIVHKNGEVVEVAASASGPATLTGNINVTNKSTNETVSYDPQNIYISFNDNDENGIADQVEIKLTPEGATEPLTFTAEDADGFTIGDFNELLLTTGIDDKTGNYTLKDLQVAGGNDADTINVQTLEDVKLAVAPVPAEAFEPVDTNPTLTGNLKVIGPQDEGVVPVDPENINISFKDNDEDGIADQVEIKLTPEGATEPLIFAAEDADGFTIGEFNELMSENGEGLKGTVGSKEYTLTGLHLEGDNSDIITDQSFSNLKSTVTDVSLETSSTENVTLGGSISMTDKSGNLVFFPWEKLEISFIDTDPSSNTAADQIKITLKDDKGNELLTFTKDEKDFGTEPTDGKISIAELGTLLSAGITNDNGYTIKGLQLEVPNEIDTNATNIIDGDYTTTVNPISVEAATPVPTTLEGNIIVTDTEGSLFYYDLENIAIDFSDTGVSITLNKKDGDTLTFTEEDEDGFTIEEFNNLMSKDGEGIKGTDTNGNDYTLKGLKLTIPKEFEQDKTVISDRNVLEVDVVPASVDTSWTVSSSLAGSITVTDTMGNQVYYNPEDIDISFKGTDNDSKADIIEITLTKKDETPLTFTVDATSFGDNNGKFSIEEFNDLLSEGIKDVTNFYTLTGLRLVGDSDTYIVNNQSLSDLKSVREVIQPPSGGAIRFTDLNNPTNFSEAEYVNPSVTTSTVVYDSLGNPYNAYLKFSKIDANTWYWKAELEDGHPLFKSTADGQLLDDPAEGVIAFDSNGNIAATQWKINPDGTIDQDLKDGDNGAAGFWFDPAKVGAALNEEVDPESAAAAGPVNVSINFQELTQFFAENSIAVTEQDGNAQGTLESFAIDNNGLIIASFTNGLTAPLGQIALATFNNPEGLSATGNSMYALSPNSGTPQIGISGVGGRGSINSGALEMSNVDLAEEFTNMIIAQRGFQANSRSITTADAILNEIINIKR